MNARIDWIVGKPQEGVEARKSHVSLNEILMKPEIYPGQSCDECGADLEDGSASIYAIAPSGDGVIAVVTCPKCGHRQENVLGRRRPS
jgi:hypothetical protein